AFVCALCVLWTSAARVGAAGATTSPVSATATAPATQPAEKPPKSVVYVCDATDSMTGLSFDLLKVELNRAIEALVPIGTFDVICFRHGEAAALSAQMLMANLKHKREAYDFLD